MFSSGKMFSHQNSLLRHSPERTESKWPLKMLDHVPTAGQNVNHFNQLHVSFFHLLTFVFWTHELVYKRSKCNKWLLQICSFQKSKIVGQKHLFFKFDFLFTSYYQLTQLEKKEGKMTWTKNLYHNIE